MDQKFDFDVWIWTPHPEDVTLLVILAVGAATGFVGGLFGKGGSALATPVLAALGVPPILAVAGPLPATLPATVLGARRYQKRGFIDGRVAWWCAGAGLPAVVVGALLSDHVPAVSLVTVTELVVIGLGLGIVVKSLRGRASEGADEEAAPPATATVVGVAAVVGLTAGLLANSGGFLLAPLFLMLLRLPVREALGTSLAVSAALAVPASLIHAALGHLDLGFVLAFAAASVPLSTVGTRVALRANPERFEIVFGLVLAGLSGALLLWG